MDVDINCDGETLTAAADWCLSQGETEEAHESPGYSASLSFLFLRFTNRPHIRSERI